MIGGCDGSVSFYVYRSVLESDRADVRSWGDFEDFVGIEPGESTLGEGNNLGTEGNNCNLGTVRYPSPPLQIRGFTLQLLSPVRGISASLQRANTSPSISTEE
jgi:hypothetical protein